MLLDSKSKMPIYQQLKTKIIEQISQGVLSPNEQLPPVRVLARELGVNPNTVQRAYSELEQMEIIFQILGKGSFVSPDYNLKPHLIKEQLTIINTELIKAKSLGVKPDAILKLVENLYKEEL